jgi:hypothetical protein
MSGIKIQTSGEYPNLWKRGLIQAQVRMRANHLCEQCGMEFQPGTNLALVEKRRNGHPLIGTVHHIDGNKANCGMSNLVYLCQRCHYRLHLYGWIPGKRLPRQWREEAPTWIRARGLEYQFNLQLFQEVQS